MAVAVGRTAGGVVARAGLLVRAEALGGAGVLGGAEARGWDAGCGVVGAVRDGVEAEVGAAAG